MMINGEQKAYLLNPDCVDLNDCGTSLLAAGIKKAVHDSLGVQVGGRPFNLKS